MERKVMNANYSLVFLRGSNKCHNMCMDTNGPVQRVKPAINLSRGVVCRHRDWSLGFNSSKFTPEPKIQQIVTTR